MRIIMLTLAALLAASTMAATASAAPRTSGSDCSYTSDEDVNTSGVNRNVVVYAGGDGVSGAADQSAGACLDLGGAVQGGGNRFDGGTFEAGANPSNGAVLGSKPGVPGAYAVIDGDNDNADPSSNDTSKGYAGLSNFETGTAPEGCLPPSNNDDGTGTNSGGCVTIYSPATGTVGAAPVPLLTCGNTTSPDRTWENSGRDGCTLPD